MTSEELISFFALPLSVSVRSMFGGHSIDAEGHIVALGLKIQFIADAKRLSVRRQFTMRLAQRRLGAS